MNKLVIGQTSQLSHFFPESYEKISSRNIKFEKKKYDSVYLTFAEQRTFNTDLSELDFIDVNVNYTKKVIEHFKDSNRIIIYGTAELWNNCNGPIDINTPINYRYSPYVKSKEILWETLINQKIKNNWKNVFIIHPFNFNSLYRKSGFLFYKIFDSLINEKIIKVGNINIERDIIHVNHLIEKSISCDCDMIVGSGKLTNIQKFTTNIFEYYNKNISDFIIQEDIVSNHQYNKFWMNLTETYDNLFLDTITEINNYYERHKTCK